MRLETGLPKPSYLRFDKLGSHAKKASLDARATRALAAPPQQALLPVVKRKEEATERQTQATHRDKEAEQDAKMILMRNYIDPKRFYKVRDHPPRLASPLWLPRMQTRDIHYPSTQLSHPPAHPPMSNHPSMPTEPRQPHAGLPDRDGDRGPYGDGATGAALAEAAEADLR